MDEEQKVVPEVINTLETPSVTSFNQQEVEAAQQKAKDSAPSFTEGFSIARGLEATAPAWESIKAGSQFMYDPEFKYSQEEFNKDVEGIDPSHWDRLFDARSADHKEFIRRDILKKQEAISKLSSMGYAGVGASLLASLLDETALTAIIASEGAAAPWIAASKGSMALRLGKAAMVGGAVDAGIGAIQYAGNPTKSPQDVMFAAAAGAILGPLGYAGILKGNMEMPVTDRALSSLSTGLQHDSSALNDSVGAARSITTPALPYDMGTHPGVAAMADHKSGLEELPWWLGGKTVGKALDTTRFSLSGIMKKSDNNVSKWVADNFLEDGVDGGQVSAALIQHTEFHHILGGYAQVRNDAYKTWKAESNFSDNPLRIFSDAEARKEFSKQVARAVRGEGTTSKPVQAVASRIAEDNKRLLKMLKESGVEGFENVSENSNYLMRNWSEETMGKFNRVYGEDQTVGLIEGAFRAVHPDIADEVSSKVAKAIFKRFNRGRSGVDGDFQKMMGNDSLDNIKEFLDDLNVDEADRPYIDTFMESMKRGMAQEGKGIPTHAKHKVLLDESYGHVLKDSQGNARHVRLSELFSEDADMLHSSYIRQMTGLVALAKKGVKSKGDWNRIIKRFEDEASTTDALKAKKDSGLKQLQYVYDSLTGRPVSDPLREAAPGASKLLGGLRDHAHLTSMGQTGFAQLPEFGSAIAQVGMKNMLAHMPGLGTIFDVLRTADPHRAAPELFKEIEDFIGGFGIDRAIHQPDARHLDVNEHFGSTHGWFSDKLSKLDTAQQYGKRAISDISGMAPITLMMDKMTVAGISQKFLGMALKPTSANLKRMESLGLSKDMLDRVLEQVRTHSSSTDSFLAGRKLKTMGYEKWTDSDAFEAYRYAVNRFGARVIQRNLLGETNPFMSTVLGKTLFQFRSFVLVAYEKQLLHNIKMHDSETITYALSGIFLAGLSYSAQTYLQSLGRQDAQKFRNKKLKPEVIAAAAFARSGMSTLVPGTVDTVLRTSGRDPVFDYRSSGYSSNFFDGVPAVNTAKKLIGSTTTLGGMSSKDYKYSKQDYRNNTGLLWFSNALGIRNVFEHMGADLPARSRKER